MSHRELGEDVDSLKQFSSDLIVEAVVRCVRVIEPGLGGALPTSLPPGMSARFRVGMSLAQACQVSRDLTSEWGGPTSLTQLHSHAHRSRPSLLRMQEDSGVHVSLRGGCQTPNPFSNWAGISRCLALSNGGHLFLVTGSSAFHPSLTVCVAPYAPTSKMNDKFNLVSNLHGCKNNHPSIIHSFNL